MGHSKKSKNKESEKEASEASDWQKGHREKRVKPWRDLSKRKPKILA